MYRRVPGLGSFTLPAETGSVNETTLMDGTVSAAQFKGVGTITGTVGALGAHPAHLFLEEKSLDGENVQVNIVRLAVAVKEIIVSEASAVATAGSMTVSIMNKENQSRCSVVYQGRKSCGYICCSRFANETDIEHGG